jgi:hypothetical protein
MSSQEPQQNTECVVLAYNSTKSLCFRTLAFVRGNEEKYRELLYYLLALMAGDRFDFLTHQQLRAHWSPS